MDYDTIAADRIMVEKYILLYARRYNPKMFAYADKLAKEKGYKVVDISLRAETLRDIHDPWYKAGVEEFRDSIEKYAPGSRKSVHALFDLVKKNNDYIMNLRNAHPREAGTLP